LPSLPHATRFDDNIGYGDNLVQPQPKKLGGRPATRTRALRAGAALLAATAAASLAGCAPADATGNLSDDEASALGSFSQGIVNGQNDSGDPATVALTVWGQQFCSASLISPTVVLTAAHCLPPNLSAEGITSYQQIQVFFGSNVGGGGESRDVIDGWTNLNWHDDQNHPENDFGMLRMSSAGPTTPYGLNTSPPVDGESVRIIGFGITVENGNDNGQKRQGSTYIDGVYIGVFTMSQSPAGVCSGDSGGTALVVRGGVEVLGGVHSRSDCQTMGIDTRVDYYMDDINNFLGNVPQPGCDADGQCASGCSAPDPDCPCAADGFCTAACPDVAADPDCNPNCVANGVCVASGCPTPDPDCACGADSYCNPACNGNDPDCAPTCPVDGVCDPSCPGDPDCWVAGDTPGVTYHGEAQGGSCALAPSRSTPSGVPGLAALTGLGLALGRRQARRRRS
jgi:hypothetical protein